MSENRCPGCGGPLPAHALGGRCPRCLLLEGLESEAPSPDGGPSGQTHDQSTEAGSTLETIGAPVGAVPHVLPRDTAFGAEPAPGDTEATRPAASTASSPAGATVERTPDPTEPEATIDGPMAPRDLERGASVRYFGDYVILEELGRGGMGVVYKARQVSLNRPVALKMIKAGVLADDAELRRFQNEAEAVALLDHPSILPIYEIGEHDGQRYFSMKLIDGSNLAEQLASFQDDPLASVALVIKAADAIQHAHMRGILHRDLKPANILIDAQGHPHITDFGLAKLMESDVELTASGAIMGTPSYMSPEQAAGRRGAMTLATDVYGLGAILYALLTGKAPFGADSVIETLDAVRNRPPERPTKCNAKVPRDLELVCLKCLEKNPADRYPTAGALADDLRHWAAGEPVSVRAAGAVERVAKWARRKPSLAAAYTFGLLTVLLGGLGGAAVWQWRAAAWARDAASTARDNEATARAAAETARDGEATARAAAEKAREGEAAARETLVRVDYGRTMEVALQEWLAGDPAATRGLIESTRADLRGWEWRYVHHLCHSDLLTLKGHTSGLGSASYSTDGSRILTASADGTAKVWDAQTGTELLTLKGHFGGVLWASFSPDGSRIVTSSGDGRAKVWDTKTGTELLTLEGHTGPVSSASFSPDGSRVLTAGQDGTAKVWDAKTGTELLTLKGHDSSVSSASFSPDGLRVVTRGFDKTAKIWDAKTGTEVLTLKGHTAEVKSASFSPDGSRVVTASSDKTAKVWDAKTGTELLTLKGHDSSVSSASFSPDGSRIVTGGDNKTAKVWDAKTGTEILTLQGHDSSVSSVSFSPDGSRILTASGDGTAKVWDARGGAEALTLNVQRRGIVTPWGVAGVESISPDGSRVVTATIDGTAKVWDAKTGTELLTLEGHTGLLSWVSFSPDGSRVLTDGQNGTVKVWDAKTGTELFTLKGHDSAVDSASFSTDGSRMVTGSFDKTAKIWDAKTGTEILTLKGHDSAVNSASFSTDGSRAVTASSDKTAKVWDAKTGTEVLTLKGHTSAVRSASFTPDGSRIATWSVDGTAKVWDAVSGAEVLTLKGDLENVTSASSSADGSRILTASWGQTVKVWDAKTGTELLTLEGHMGPHSWVSFSADGSRVLTRSFSTAKIWDTIPFKGSQLAMASRLPAILAGKDQAASNTERLVFAQMAYDGRNYTAAARLWAEAWLEIRNSTSTAGISTAGNPPVPRPWRPPGKATTRPGSTTRRRRSSAGRLSTDSAPS